MVISGVFGKVGYHMRKIAIRIDDVTEDMDWEKFHRFEALLEKYGIRPLIGVIPANRDQSLAVGEKKKNYADWLKEKQRQGWMIAMHGYDHIYTTKKGGMFPLNHFSEFAGLDFATQVYKLREGVKAMRAMNLRTEIFMAPAHSFDRNTVKALKMCGFRYITDGFGSGPYERGGMIYLPIAVQKSKELKKKDGITTFVVHTATMREEDFRSYEKIFEKFKEQFVSYDEMLQINAVSRNLFLSIWEYSLAVMKNVLCRVRMAGR